MVPQYKSIVKWGFKRQVADLLLPQLHFSTPDALSSNKISGSTREIKINLVFSSTAVLFCLLCKQYLYYHIVTSFKMGKTLIKEDRGTFV